MSDTPQRPGPPNGGDTAGWPASPPTAGPGSYPPDGAPAQPGQYPPAGQPSAPHPASQQITPLDRIADTRPEVPLHPLLPGGSGGERLASHAYGVNAHQAPHAASAGPSDGARGALWFVIGMAVLVGVCLLGALFVSIL
ncbi:MAG: hypothetical protein ACR2HR_13465 [Euzebya sp.]